jgi:predicted ATPase/class 3 adenylate cyclase
MATVAGTISPGAERRLLTVMFCDLVDSTVLASRLDPEDLRAVIGEYHKDVATVVRRFDGFVARYMGDGVLAYFGYPRAHEDDPERAVRAGLDIVATTRLVPAAVGGRLRVRVGIATGLVVVGDFVDTGETRERDVVGETPNLAARLQTLAEPDSVVIAASTHELAGGIFEYEELGKVRRFPERATREPELLAHHLTEARQIEPAIGYWLKAGERAIERSANLEAIRHLARGLEALKTLPESPGRDRQELAFQIALGTPLIALHGYSDPQTGAAYSRARVLCERLGEAEPLVATLSGEFVYYFVRGDYRTMRRLSDEARQVSQRLPNPVIRLASYRLAGITAMHLGAFAEARSEFEAILELYDARQHRSQPVHYVHDPKVSALTYLALVLWILGLPEQARRSSNEAFRCAAELDQANLSAHVHNFAGAGLDELLGDVLGVRAHAEAIVELADRHNLGYWRVNGLILRGWAMVQEGATEAGIALMRQNAANRAALGVGWYQARYLCMLAAAYARVGQAEPGLRVVAEAKALVAANDEHMWEGELDRIEGELKQVQGASATEIETCFARAIAITRIQGAKSLELRATRDLARLWHDHGRHRDACALLAPAFGWFKEGFETADLRATKALLDELT